MLGTWTVSFNRSSALLGHFPLHIYLHIHTYEYIHNTNCIFIGTFIRFFLKVSSSLERANLQHCVTVRSRRFTNDDIGHRNFWHFRPQTYPLIDWWTWLTELPWSSKTQYHCGIGPGANTMNAIRKFDSLVIRVWSQLQWKQCWRRKNSENSADASRKYWVWLEELDILFFFLTDNDKTIIMQI